MGYLDAADNVELTIPCAHCGEETTKLIGGLKAEPKFDCPNCKVLFDLSNLDFAEISKKLGEQR